MVAIILLTKHATTIPCSPAWRAVALRPLKGQGATLGYARAGVWSRSLRFRSERAPDPLRDIIVRLGYPSPVQLGQGEPR